MDRIRPDQSRDPDHRLDIQVAGHGVRRIWQKYRLVREVGVQRTAFGIGVDGDRLNAKTPAGPDDPARGLAPVCYEDFVKQRAFQNSLD